MLERNIVCALPSEAAHLIETLKLRRDTKVTAFRVYRGEHTNLIVSGVGNIASASAVAYLAGNHPRGHPAVWLNVGISGHLSLPIGSIAIAHEIQQHTTGNRVYPAIVFPVSIDSRPLVSFDVATTEYAGLALCDMEAYGYFKAATRFASVEFVHAVKIVSDNNESGLSKITREMINELMAPHTPSIIAILNELSDLAATTQEQAQFQDLSPLTEAFHFTFSQNAQLEALAQRWSGIKCDTPFPESELLSSESAEQVIANLSEILDQTGLWRGNQQ